MFFSFISFITSRGFFWTCSENIVYDDVYDDMMTLKMMWGYFLKVLVLQAEGRGVRAKGREVEDRGLRAKENRDPDIWGLNS